MLERFLDQIGEVLRLCEDTDGILVVNREGIIEYHRIPLNSYWCSQDTVGRHILELYPELDGERQHHPYRPADGPGQLQRSPGHQQPPGGAGAAGVHHHPHRGGRPGGVRGGLVQVPHH